MIGAKLIKIAVQSITHKQIQIFVLAFGPTHRFYLQKIKLSENYIKITNICPKKLYLKNLQIK